MNFDKIKSERIASYSNNTRLQNAGYEFTYESTKENYMYNFSWLGRPVIQFPQDIVAIQELIFDVQPNLIIETGIAHGGSLILSASILALNEVMGGSKNSMVVGVDIDIRAHNRKAIEDHPLSSYIKMIEGSSTDRSVIRQISEIASGKEKVLVFLDSNHSHEHVFLELKAYAPLVTRGSFCVVFDTFVEDMPEDFVVDRPWGRGNNPKTAVKEYLSFLNEDGGVVDQNGECVQFAADKEIDNKLIVSCNTGGFLKRM